MNDSRLKSELEGAFLTPDLDPSMRGRIWRMSQSMPPPSRRRGVRKVLGLAVALGAAGCSYPVINANYISMSIASYLRLDQAMIVTWSFPHTTLPPGVQVADPVEFALADGTVSFRSQIRGSKSFWLSKGGLNYRFLGPEDRVIVRHQPDQIEKMLRQADQLMSEFETFRLKRKARIETVETASGRRSVAVLTSDDGNGTFRISLDPITNLPEWMQNYGKGSRLPGMRLDYKRDPIAARSVIGARWKEIQSSPMLDLDERRKAIWLSYAAHPLVKKKTGRDLLTVYSVERNRQGDVFVLYTFKGYHGGEDRSGNYLRMKDGTGTEWLSDSISFFGQKVRLNGEFPKAQVFFHPSGPGKSSELELFARMNDWEFVGTNEVFPHFESSNRVLPLLRRTPAEVPFLQPDWMHFAFNVNDPEWLQCDAMKLRFLNAMRTKRFRDAQRFGKELEAVYPGMMIGLFYSRCQLFLGLYHAFSATADKGLARAYLRKAIDHAQEDWGDSFRMEDLKKARQQEGL